jgi:hypothetical protein
MSVRRIGHSLPCRGFHSGVICHACLRAFSGSRGRVMTLRDYLQGAVLLSVFVLICWEPLL